MRKSLYWCVLALLMVSPAHAQGFRRDVIYQIVTDRFFDGDPGNNDPANSSGPFDAGQTNWSAYWGGDFVGVEAKLPYLRSMGVTGIWISPVADNVKVTPYDNSKAGDRRQS